MHWFTTTLQGHPEIAIFIALASDVLYPAYASAPRLWGITPLADQQLGGLIMWIPGGLFFTVVLSIIFFKWSQTDGFSTDQQTGVTPLAPEARVIR